MGPLPSPPLLLCVLVLSQTSQVALRIRPLKREEISRGYKAVANKVDDKVRIGCLDYLIFFF